MSFTTPVDIANRALQHLGVLRIAAFTDSSQQANEANFCYDKLRRAELRRSVWTFSTRRAVMRPITSTTKNVVPEAFDAAATYAAGDIVTLADGTWWFATAADVTAATTPGSYLTDPNNVWLPYFGPLVHDVWSATVTYYPGDLVYKTGATQPYVLLGLATSLNADPASGAPWHALLDGGVSALVNVASMSPIGFSPSGASQRNLYKLPNNFMRLAPQDPKAASTVRLLVTSGQRYNDWELESGFLVTASAIPFIFRFASDLTAVSQFDDLFCEGLAARMAMEMCETLTQSPPKMQEVTQIYGRWIAEARAVSAIEAGTTEPETPELAPAVPAQGGEPARGG